MVSNDYWSRMQKTFDEAKTSKALEDGLEEIRHLENLKGLIYLRIKKISKNNTLK